MKRPSSSDPIGHHHRNPKTVRMIGMASSRVNVMNIYFQGEAAVKSLSVGWRRNFGSAKPPSLARRVDPEAAQIDQHVRLQEFRCRHRQRALRAIGASE